MRQQTKIIIQEINAWLDGTQDKPDNLTERFHRLRLIYEGIWVSDFFLYDEKRKGMPMNKS